MTAHTGRLHLCVTVRGAVQGVGFRPFVYRLATSLGLTGWVNNSSQGVFIEVEGHKPEPERFLLRIGPEKPPRSFIQSLESSFLDAVGYKTFEIRASDGTGEKTALVLPDIATCPDCLADILDPHNRRYRYPFTNCTNCGPRFSIIQALPYDRPNTTMRAFQMCESCLAEYEDPLDRRFHAHPNACPECGPHLVLWNANGDCLVSRDEALLAAADAVRRGDIIAVKGLGGFHLVVDARNERSAVELARRKHREEKPFALMYPSLESAAQDCQASELEERLLRSPEAPIVLLQRRAETLVAPSVAPRNPYLGVMLPYTPLHHLLLGELGFPIVATSGNLSDDPICTDEHEALQRPGGIADLFLVHNRPIARHVDDSIVRVIMGREIVMRRARGYAPLPVPLVTPAPPVLAVGAHLKNTIAVSIGRQAFVSQHISDLETAQAFDAFQRVIASFRQLYEVSPTAVACDAHPNYLSTQWAAQSGLPVVSVQHHHAHLLAYMAENELEGPVLGVSWDGTGYGSDGTVWGGESCAQPRARSSASVTCAPSDFPEARWPCTSPGARRWAFSTRSWARRYSTGQSWRLYEPSRSKNAPSCAPCSPGTSMRPSHPAPGGSSTPWPPSSASGRSRASRARWPWSWSTPWPAWRARNGTPLRWLMDPAA